jgi:hypothetical protein
MPPHDRRSAVTRETFGQLREARSSAGGRVWLKAIHKGGRLLREMREKRERAGRGGDQKSKSPGATLIELDDLGFTKSRSSRWQLAEQLP